MTMINYVSEQESNQKTLFQEFTTKFLHLMPTIFQINQEQFKEMSHKSLKVDNKHLRFPPLRQVLKVQATILITLQ